MTATEPGIAHMHEQARTPRYDLTAEEMQQREAEMAEIVKGAYGETVAAVWVSSDSPYADAVRTHELAIFPEIAEVMAPYEDESEFLTLVDTRGGTDRIVHAFRISSPGLTPEVRATLPAEPENEVNIAFVQDLVASGQMTEAEFVAYYKDRGVDLDRSVSVETNFRIGERVEAVNGIHLTQLGYLTLFNAASSPDPEAPERMVFAHLNRVATVSLGAMGIQYEPVMGDPELKTPTTDHKFDPKYHPVAIPTQQNAAVFNNLSAAAPPVIEL